MKRFLAILVVCFLCSCGPTGNAGTMTEGTLPSVPSDCAVKKVDEVKYKDKTRCQQTNEFTDGIELDRELSEDNGRVTFNIFCFKVAISCPVKNCRDNVDRCGKKDDNN